MLASHAERGSPVGSGSEARTISDTWPVLGHFPEVIREDLPLIAEALSERLPALSGKRILITGAGGFLPAYLADTLVYLNDTGALGEPCRLLLLARNAQRLKKRLGHLNHRGDVEFLMQDVRDPIVRSGTLDLMIHAAAPASPKDYRRDPVGSLEANTLGLRNLLELCRSQGARSALYLSSSEVYGSPEPDQIPTPEGYVGRVDPLGPRAAYAEAKRAGEAFCAAYHEQYATPVKIVRPFHIHGPGLRPDDGRIIAELVSMGIRGERLSLLSEGRATRTYGYVLDATVDVFNVLLSEHDGQAFNVGVAEPETSILELATLIARCVGQQEPVLTRSGPAAQTLRGAPERACPDLTKLRRTFPYRPQIGLEDGLRKTIRWMTGALGA